VDCEKFDRVVLDLLYDELDELTTAAARRHMDHCARCRPIGASLRATRSVGVLPLTDPPLHLLGAILGREEEARLTANTRQRVGRGISILAGYAMRPQVAMAAVLLLMIGLGLLLLQVRPTEPVATSERGVPEFEAESAPSAADLQRRETPPAEDAARDTADEGEATAGDAYARGVAAFRAGHFADAKAEFERVAKKGSQQGATAELWSAQATRQLDGCDAAAPLFERIAHRHSGTSLAHEASWQLADCYRAKGRVEPARREYLRLLTVDSYAERARAALDDLGGAPDASLIAARPAPQADSGAASAARATRKGEPNAANEAAAEPGSASPATSAGSPSAPARGAAPAKAASSAEQDSGPSSASSSSP
jgi:tetratricopeptide (TPR) repeat protein